MQKQRLTGELWSPLGIIALFMALFGLGNLFAHQITFNSSMTYSDTPPVEMQTVCSVSLPVVTRERMMKPFVY